MWLKVHPLSRAVALLDDQLLFVRLGRHGDEQPLPLSAVAVHRLVRRSCVVAGVPERLAHPHVLRAYWAARQPGFSPAGHGPQATPAGQQGARCMRLPELAIASPVKLTVRCPT